MPNPSQLLPGAIGQPRPQIIYGQVSSTQPTPTSFSDPLFVVIPQWQPHYFRQIDDWPECHGASLPRAGAQVVLAQDTTGTFRCLWWDGKHSPAMAAPFCNKLTNYLLA